MEGSVVEIGPLAIHFVERGTGVPVLYVHGNVASSRFYEHVMDVPGAHTVALDMPNFGRSTPMSGEPDIDRYADTVAAFIRARSLDRPVLVGHSLGGAVAMSLAARAPNLVRSLVLVDSCGPGGIATSKDRYPLFEMMRSSRPLLAQVLRAQVPTLKDDAFFETLVDEAMVMAAPAWVGHAEALGRFDYRGRLAVFTGPVLVLRGGKDLLITEEMARDTVAAFPDARLEIVDDVGHSVMAEDPARFVALIGEFLSAGRAKT